MVANGWAQLHRDLILEVARDGPVVDVRDNNGGHTSELVLEKLARTVKGWDIPRQPGPTYPACAARADRRGDQPARRLRRRHRHGGFTLYGIGPVVGTRTWGGVIGIDGRYTLVDGTSVTQPRYALWFEGSGWGIENYGVDPDVEVDIAPQDWAAGRDPQLERAVQMVLEALETRPARARPTGPPGRPGSVRCSAPGRSEREHPSGLAAHRRPRAGAARAALSHAPSVRKCRSHRLTRPDQGSVAGTGAAADR